MTAVDTAVTPDAIMQLGFGFWGSKTLLSAVELGLFSQLEREGPLDLETLRGRLGLHPRSARDFFDVLVALGLLERHDGRYRNTPETATFLDRAKPSYVGGILEMANARLYPFWASLTDGLKSGQPQNEIKSGDRQFFERLYADPARLEQFLSAMTGLSMGPARALAATFPWRDYRTFADLGTAQGGTPVQLALTHPHLTGVGFDLPPVEPIFDAYVASFGLSDRLRFQAGDFWVDPFPRADVIVLGLILHDWNLEEKRLLLRKAHQALPAGGAVVVYDAIFDDDRRQNSFGLLMSLSMLIELPGGFDYTGADCQGWLRETGFRETRVEHLVGPISTAVGIK